MKILYGVQGTGNGHITRARALSVEFAKLGIEVDYIFSGRDEADYFDMDCFGTYRTFKGLSFVAKNGRVSMLETYKQAQLIRLIKDINTLDVSQYDLVLTDFEPITAWAAKRQGKPCLGVGHQYAFNYEIPKYHSDALGAWIMSRFTPVTRSVGVHWHHFGEPILPPIIQHHENAEPAEDDQVLVYLPFENSDDVLEWLEAVPHYQFRVHCKDIEPGQYGNVRIYPFSREQFQTNLRQCKSVLCNAGFELNSEALHMGRRIMVKPLHGQVEQLSNVVALKYLEFAQTTESLNSDIIADWLDQAKVVKVAFPNVAAAIAQWVANGATESLESLSHSLWQQVTPTKNVNFGDTIQSQLSIAS